jgi:hypothetical protein
MRIEFSNYFDEFVTTARFQQFRYTGIFRHQRRVWTRFFQIFDDRTRLAQHLTINHQRWDLKYEE